VQVDVGGDVLVDICADYAAKARADERSHLDLVLRASWRGRENEKAYHERLAAENGHSAEGSAAKG
jgi:hypothetical protein